MKTPWRWLLQYVDLPWTPQEACSRFTDVGLKVENLTYEELPVHRVVSALVHSVTPHPKRGDQNVGVLRTNDRQYTVVSGAPGMVPGNIVLLAEPGATLPGGVEIGTKDFLGVPSMGMVVAANEILTGGPHRPGEDIVILPQDTPLGVDVKKLFDLDDWVIEFELTVNYSHCLSILGVAIEASALSGQPLRLPPVLSQWDWAGSRGSRPPGDDPQIPGEWTVELPDPNLCPRYVGKVVRNLGFAYSGMTIERRLMLAGMRPISAVVDATNYVMLETGQPLHAFDLDKLVGKVISARASRAGEPAITTLDGEERQIPEGAVVIADGAGPVALGGIMGGARTEVGPDTKNILLESAFFAPLPTRRAYRNLRLRTEAAIRFEKKVDPTAQAAVIERAASLVAALTGGTPEAGRSDARATNPVPLSLGLSAKAAKRTLGVDLSRDRLATYLSDLRFGVRNIGYDAIEVTVPPRRVDIEEEIDLVEEIARYYGYGNVEDETLYPATPGGPPDKEYVWFDRMKDFLVSLGGHEVVVNPLIAPKDLLAMGWGEDDGRGNAVALQDPLSSSESILRTSLLPGVLRVAVRNQSVGMPGGMFWEVGRVFFPSPEELPHEANQLVIVASGILRPGNWAQEETHASYFGLKGVFSSFLGLMGIDATFLPGASMPMHPGRSARVMAGYSAIGEIGEIHPGVLDDLGLTGPCAAAWIAVDAVLALARERSFEKVPRFMPVTRDLAVLVDLEVAAGDVIDIIRVTASDLASVTLFDVYTGPPVPEGKKNLALRLIYQPKEKTLREADLAASREEMLRVLSRKLGAEARV